MAKTSLAPVSRSEDGQALDSVCKTLADVVAELMQRDDNSLATLRISFQAGVVTHVRDTIERGVPAGLASIFVATSPDDLEAALRPMIIRLAETKMFGELELSFALVNRSLRGYGMRRERVTKLKTLAEAGKAEYVAH